MNNNSWYWNYYKKKTQSRKTEYNDQNKNEMFHSMKFSLFTDVKENLTTNKYLQVDSKSICIFLIENEKEVS